ncbi:MAG: Fe-S protein assembly chaperone HscA [Planctomycetes bacterium]|nr:Fe-S protein assembly chaperone HscA [Planctomycetota bacterium]
MSPIVGIDLGTTHSLVAICDESGPRVLLDDQGRALLPSVVRFLGPGKSSVGWRAKQEAAKFPESTIASSKRFMGRGHKESESIAAELSVRLKAGPRGLAAFDVQGTAVTPQEVAAEVLSELRRIAESRLGVKVTRAVITVPAYFDDAQRQATHDAARLCGLTVERIVNEPTAAALAYGLGRKGKPETVAIYDLGGGTFDVSILRIEPMDSADPGSGEAFQVLSTRGDTRLGGDDFDQLIAQWLQKEFVAEHRGAKIDAGQWTAFGMAAEQAKRELSNRETATIEVRAGGEAGKELVLRRQLTRANFQMMIAPLIDRTIEAFKQAHRDANSIKIDRVVLVGGSTRIPYVRERVAALTGLTPYTALDPDQVVALGAAVQASILAGGRRDLLLLDVIPLSLGIETQGGAFAKLILRNSAIPSRATEMFTTSKDNQSGVLIHVAQGEREMVADCRSIARFELRGLPAMPAGIPQVEVEFLVDANGVLNVSAVERRSGMRAAIQAAPSYGLTAAEVEQIERDSLTHAREDMHRHRVTDLAVNARLDVKWIGEALTRTREALLPAYVAELEGAMKALLALCDQAERDPGAVDANAMQKAKELLDRQSVHLHETSIAQSLRDMRVSAAPKP